MTAHKMRRVLLWLLLSVALLIGVVAYRSRSSKLGLDVEPHAAEEIEKAKRR